MKYINRLCGQNVECITAGGALHHPWPISVWNKPCALYLWLSRRQNSMKPSRAYIRVRLFKHTTNVSETNFFSILRVLRYLSNLGMETKFVSGIFVFELMRLKFVLEDNDTPELSSRKTCSADEEFMRGFSFKTMTERNHLKDVWERRYCDFIELDPIEVGCKDLECIRLIRILSNCRLFEYCNEAFRFRKK